MGVGVAGVGVGAFAGTGVGVGELFTGLHCLQSRGHMAGWGSSSQIEGALKLQGATVLSIAVERTDVTVLGRRA